MWLLHWLPLPLLAACGRLFGRLFYWFGRRRRHIARVNLGLCFPELSAAQKSALAGRHARRKNRRFTRRASSRC